ncbi:MAG TPA: D-aminoacyl-tRNA deacylase [Burkholderiales bacterium]|nr:D-aminoacyl-tRNA deacylase [Burkholderiales bacterium]
MIAVIQRVAEAGVSVDGRAIARIGPGILALVGVERGDSEREAVRLAERVAGYRVFPDAQGRMNLSLGATRGALLAVPQFTLAADTGKGARPSFSFAATPEAGERLFDCFVAHCCTLVPEVGVGRFGANMKVNLVNDGPVTFWLRCAPAGGS